MTEKDKNLVFEAFASFIVFGYPKSEGPDGVRFAGEYYYADTFYNARDEFGDVIEDEIDFSTVDFSVDEAREFVSQIEPE